jgi:hypothetical protein
VKVTVRSFTNGTIAYTVICDEDGYLVFCDCPDFTENKVVCKHMFLAARVTEYAIDFESPQNDEELSNEELDARLRLARRAMREVEELVREARSEFGGLDLDSDRVRDINKDNLKEFISLIVSAQQCLGY